MKNSCRRRIENSPIIVVSVKLSWKLEISWKRTCNLVTLANKNIIHLAHFNREGYSWVSTNQKIRKWILNSCLSSQSENLIIRDEGDSKIPCNNVIYRTSVEISCETSKMNSCISSQSENSKITCCNVIYRTSVEKPWILSSDILKRNILKRKLVVVCLSRIKYNSLSALQKEYLENIQN